MSADLKALWEYFEKHPATAELQQKLKADQEISVGGLAGSSGVFLSTVLLKNYPRQVHIFPESEAAAQFLNDLENVGQKSAYYFPSSLARPGEEEGDSGMMLLRTKAVREIQDAPHWTWVTYKKALMEKVVPADQLKKAGIRLNVGEKISQDFLTEWLETMGFTLAPLVYAPGQYALRGGLIDVFSYASEWPVRVLFDEENVTGLRFFDPVDQRSKGHVENVEILPDPLRMTEACFPASLWPRDTLVWLWDAVIPENALDIQDEEAAWRPLAGLRRIVTGSLSGRAFLNYDCLPQPAFHKNFELLAQTWRSLHEAARPILFFSDQESQAERMREIMAALQGPPFSCVPFSLQCGFFCGATGPACFADHLLFDRYRRFRLKVHYVREGSLTLRDLGRLRPGDFVTHMDHGVGRFAGLEKVQNGGQVQECIRLIYKDGDTLLVGLHNLHKIARYSGAEGQEPALHKLGGTAWKNTKNRTKKRIKQLAFDLIKLYARRKLQPGYAFSPDTYLQKELESSFLFEDTPDQLKATQETKADMEKPWPMDRLICGDVGFGKTEIAIRAAFKAACDGKQTAMLVPTTILALQHFKTFSARLKDFPVRVEYLSRFRTPAQKKAILKDVASGKIDILIGTHLLTSDGVQFKDLGLLIIDEEQKFGVNVKEKIKNLKTHVDTLTLTATPIPRTLQLSLLGARDMSVIRTPPPNRQPVTTELHTFSETFIKEAIQFELQRGGQVFFIHNRVQDIHDIAAMVQRLAPASKVGVAHGQMEGRQLEEVMIDFLEGRIRILVSTAIVESGLDVPEANTMIIHNAHHLGLSDLHQLRGRVGRSNRKAFCYLITPPLSLLTEEARKRLKALVEFSELGSGLHIALRDLDLRGAGDLLGAEQSGFISEMGYDAYQKILQEAMRELKKEEALTEDAQITKASASSFSVDCQLETDFSLLLPDTYVADIAERLALYRELDDLEDDEALNAFKEKMEDRFGPLPPEAHALLDSMRLRNAAGRLGIEKLTLRSGKISLYWMADARFYTTAPVFEKALHWIQTEPEGRLIQKPDRVVMVVPGVQDVKSALEKIQRLEYLCSIQIEAATTTSD